MLFDAAIRNPARVSDLGRTGNAEGPHIGGGGARLTTDWVRGQIHKLKTVACHPLARRLVGAVGEFHGAQGLAIFDEVHDDDGTSGPEAVQSRRAAGILLHLEKLHSQSFAFDHGPGIQLE